MGPGQHCVCEQVGALWPFAPGCARAPRRSERASTRAGRGGRGWTACPVYAATQMRVAGPKWRAAGRASPRRAWRRAESTTWGSPPCRWPCGQRPPGRAPPWDQRPRGPDQRQQQRQQQAHCRCRCRWQPRGLSLRGLALSGARPRSVAEPVGKEALLPSPPPPPPASAGAGLHCPRRRLLRWRTAPRACLSSWCRRWRAAPCRVTAGTGGAGPAPLGAHPHATTPPPPLPCTRRAGGGRALARRGGTWTRQQRCAWEESRPHCSWPAPEGWPAPSPSGLRPTPRCAGAPGAASTREHSAAQTGEGGGV